MVHTIELSDELAARLEVHLEEDETFEELIDELVTIYEQEGRFLAENPDSRVGSVTCAWSPAAGERPPTAP